MRLKIFSKITRQRIRRGVFRSIAELQAAINWYLKDTMMIPGPSSGPTGDVILPKLNRLPVPSV